MSKLTQTPTDFMERKRGTDVSADANRIKILSWVLAAFEHACTIQLHRSH